jgi:hypothetical protein
VNSRAVNESERFGSGLPEGVFLVFVEMDWAHGTCRFVRSDGKEAVFSDNPFPRFSDVFVKSTYFMEMNRIVLETERGRLAWRRAADPRKHVSEEWPPCELSRPEGLEFPSERHTWPQQIGLGRAAGV